MTGDEGVEGGGRARTREGPEFVLESGEVGVGTKKRSSTGFAVWELSGVNMLLLMSGHRKVPWGLQILKPLLRTLLYVWLQLPLSCLSPIAAAPVQGPDAACVDGGGAVADASVGSLSSLSAFLRHLPTSSCTITEEHVFCDTLRSQ